MSDREYCNQHLMPGEDDRGANDEGYYYDYCSICNAKTEHEDESCIECWNKNLDKKRKETKAKPYIDRFLANDPIDW